MLHLSPYRVAVSRPLLCAAVAVGWRNHSCFFSPRFQHLAFRVVGARPRSNPRPDKINDAIHPSDVPYRQR